MERGTVLVCRIESIAALLDVKLCHCTCRNLEQPFVFLTILLEEHDVESGRVEPIEIRLVQLLLRCSMELQCVNNLFDRNLFISVPRNESEREAECAIADTVEQNLDIRVLGHLVHPSVCVFSLTWGDDIHHLNASHLENLGKCFLGSVPCL